MIGSNMDAWVPQCKPLKEKYDACMQEWVDKKLINVTFGGLHTCADHFEDYKDCVTIGMKMRNSWTAGGGACSGHPSQSSK